MMEVPYNNEVKYCAYCGYLIIYNEVADPKSKDREKPDYFHISCYNHEQENRDGEKPL